MKDLKRLSHKMGDQVTTTSHDHEPRPSSPKTHDQAITKTSDHQRIKSDIDHESSVKKVVANSDDIVASSQSLVVSSYSTRNSNTMNSEENGRERLKRHRIEMAGRVWIPDIWGQEELLKDWIDCSAFDACLVPNGIISARNALIQEGTRASSGGLRIENRC